MKVKSFGIEWIDVDLHSLMITRNYYIVRRAHWDKYTSLRKEVTTRLRQAKTVYYITISQSIAQKPKAIWNRLNEVLGRKKLKPMSVLKCGENFCSSQSKLQFRTALYVHTITHLHQFGKHNQSCIHCPEDKVCCDSRWKKRHWTRQDLREIVETGCTIHSPKPHTPFQPQYTLWAVPKWVEVS